MAEAKCENCRFYRKAGRDGECVNIEHVQVKWVGGGGEYSSSARVLAPVEVWPTQWCELHEPPRPRVAIRPVTEAELIARWEEDNKMYRGLVTETMHPSLSYRYRLGGK